MVKPLQRAEVKTFSGGLITDAPALEFPGHASIDESNFDNNYDGSRSRRKGLKRISAARVPTYGETYTNRDDISTFVWEAPAGDVTINLLVVSSGGSINFFNATARKPFENLIASVPRVSWETQRDSFASVSGYLVCVSGGTTFTLISYNPDDRTVAIDQFRRYNIRDIFGIEDKTDPFHETEPTYRGVPLTPEHYYNLYNQGWALPRLPWLFGEHPPQDAVAMASAASSRNPGSRSPSNADTVWQGMDVRNVGRETIDTGDNKSYVYTSAECFNQAQYLTAIPSGSETAKGYFIIDAFSRGISRASAWANHKTMYPQTGNLVVVDISTFPADTTRGGPTCVESHSGRAFFSGIKSGAPVDGDKRSPNWTNAVFFTKVIDKEDDFSKFYTEGDPTSREGSDVVDTDGGFINIAGATNIHQLVSFGKYLLVLAENGVWTISGTDGFTATSFKVNKVSNFGCANKDTVAVVGGAVFFLGLSAAYKIGLNQFGDVEVMDITTQSLSKFYRQFSHDVLQSAISAVDLETNTVHWMIYSSYDNPEFVWDLRFDSVRGCFIPMKITLPQGRHLRFMGMHQIPNFNRSSIGPTPVGGWISAGSWITTWVFGPITDQYYIQAEFSDENFRDWAGVYTPEGVDAVAYLETGATTAGDVAVKKQIPYLTMVFRNKEKGDIVPDTSAESSCLGRVKWDFSDKITANRWGREMQLYRLSRPYMDENGFIDNGQTMTITKSKLRGNGKSFSLRLETEPLKDCHIIGWSLTLTGNGVT